MKTCVFSHVYVMEPVNLLGSVPPKVSSPFSELSVVAGAKKTETISAGIVPYIVITDAISVRSRRSQRNNSGIT